MSKALVMSGGGPVGLAWETGVVAGLSANGFDFGEAEFVLGTSAGASVCAQIALGRDFGRPVERYRARVQQPPSQSADAAASVSRPATQAATPGQWGATSPMLRIGTMMSVALSDGLTPEQARAIVGQYAIEGGSRRCGFCSRPQRSVPVWERPQVGVVLSDDELTRV